MSAKNSASTQDYTEEAKPNHRRSLVARVNNTVRTVELEVKKNRSFSFLDLLRFVGKFVIAYVFFGLSIYATHKLTKPAGQGLNGYEVRVLLIATCGLVMISYVQELLGTKRAERRIRDDKIIYDCIGGAIDRFVELKSQSDVSPDAYVNHILGFVQRVVVLTLQNNGIRVGELCVNLMVKRESPLRLELKYFGVFLHGRKKRSLPVDANAPLPGAPEAFHYKKTMYVDNTMSETYARFFDPDKPYRSIISVPVLGLDEEVVGVLNIDSHEPYQFVSVDFVNKRILPAISPLVLLLTLETELVFVDHNMQNDQGEGLNEEKE